MLKKELLKALLEALKFPVRQAVLAVIPVALVYFASLPYEWAGILYTVFTLLDKFLHELWKDQKDKPKGIIPF